MSNPYAQPPARKPGAPGAPAAPLSPEEQKREDYQTAVGSNIRYYLPKFASLDAGGSKIGWHWPAFFVTSAWYLYRKMYLWGLLNLAYPFFAMIVLGIVMVAARPSPGMTVLICVAVFGIPTLLLTLFANALYWRHVNNVITRIPRNIAAQPDRRQKRIERNGGTSVGAMIGVLGGIFIFGSGILAAIAIPAYQDYTIRAQIFEGLNLAAGVKAQVAEFYLQQERWPDQADLDGEPPSGRYVKSIEVQGGSVIITYGNAVNSRIADQRLVLSPALDMQGELSWICGNGRVQPGVRMAGGPFGSEIADKYLPSACRTKGESSPGS